MPMAITAENLGQKYKLARNDVDEFAYQSQKKWKDGICKNNFRTKIIAVSYVKQ